MTTEPTTTSTEWMRGPRIGSAFGAPVHVGYSAILSLAGFWFLGGWRAALLIAAGICLHELGHVLRARKLHLKIESIELALLHGNVEYSGPTTAWDRGVIAWGGLIWGQLPVFLISLGWLWSDPLEPDVWGIGLAWSMVTVFWVLAPLNDGEAALPLVPMVMDRRRERQARAAKRAGLPTPKSDRSMFDVRGEPERRDAPPPSPPRPRVRPSPGTVKTAKAAKKPAPVDPDAARRLVDDAIAQAQANIRARRPADSQPPPEAPDPPDDDA